MNEPVSPDGFPVVSTSWEQEVRNHQEFRSQMVSNFGFAVMDQGLAITRCQNCEKLTSINSAFPDSDWNSLFHLMSVLESFVESEQLQLNCANCNKEIGISGNKGTTSEYWLWHAHFLGEMK